MNTLPKESNLIYRALNAEDRPQQSLGSYDRVTKAINY